MTYAIENSKQNFIDSISVKQDSNGNLTDRYNAYDVVSGQFITYGFFSEAWVNKHGIENIASVMFNDLVRIKEAQLNKSI